MGKRMQKKQHAGDQNHKMSKDLLREEFGGELGDYNAMKPYEGALESKNKNCDKE
ncbi:hypothetical protein ACSVDA_09355 [Cytobacillus sp. Hm23]|uniref:hypothetical protein n=1 Tax=Bacillaceae TaxID=186817 RepID=UPI002A0E0022|nr:MULTISPECIES: hypothetical protein [unclassified Cytobacillus]MDX8360469.1 hypothetical protein [Cytobacillus sp. IB215316]MDX8365772.1 hypothetical protein [Cytobacillus sp. IB215665]